MVAATASKTETAHKRLVAAARAAVTKMPKDEKKAIAFARLFAVSGVVDDRDRALRIVRDIPKAFDRAAPFLEVILCFARAQPEVDVALIQELVSEVNSSREAWRWREKIDAIAMALAERGCVEEAFSLISKKEAFYRGEGLYKLARIFVAQGKEAETLRAVGGVGIGSTNFDALHSIACELASAGCFVGALELALKGRTCEIVPAILGVALETGTLSRVPVVLAGIENEARRAEFVCLVAQEVLRRDGVTNAFMALLAVVDDLPGQRERERGDLALQVAKRGNLDEAKRIVSALTGNYVSEWVLPEFIPLFLGARRELEALQMADRISVVGKKDKALALIAVALAKRGECERALEVARSITSPDVQREAFLAAAQAAAVRA